MFIDIDELKLEQPFCDIPEAILRRKIRAIEEAVRAYTNNPFIIQETKIEAKSEGGNLIAAPGLFAIGDSVTIAYGINAGVYVVDSIDGEKITLDKRLRNADNVAFLTIYPHSVTEGAISMLRYDIDIRPNAGIASETISRHSVSYESTTNVGGLGYPSNIVGFLQPYRRVI